MGGGFGSFFPAWGPVLTSILLALSLPTSGLALASPLSQPAVIAKQNRPIISNRIETFMLSSIRKMLVVYESKRRRPRGAVWAIVGGERKITVLARTN